jgi:MarR family transcriptional regulator, organic hydroperoxide resistance regulator
MSSRKSDPRTADIMLRHWREAVPNDRIAHLVKDAGRGLQRALQVRLAKYNVSFGHWVFLRILWVREGITQRELSEEAGLMEPTTFSALTAMEKLGYIERRKLKKKLVPLAEEVNEIAVQGVEPADVATARRVLLVMIENIARDEAEHADPARAARMRRMLESADEESARKNESEQID